MNKSCTTGGCGRISAWGLFAPLACYLSWNPNSLTALQRKYMCQNFAPETSTSRTPVPSFSVRPAGCLLTLFQKQALSKELWRTGFLDCPSNCSMETPWKDCQCLCDAGKMGNRSAAQVLKESGVLDAVSYYDATGEMVSKFENEEVRAVRCYYLVVLCVEPDLIICICFCALPFCRWKYGCGWSCRRVW